MSDSEFEEAGAVDDESDFDLSSDGEETESDDDFVDEAEEEEEAPKKRGRGGGRGKGGAKAPAIAKKGAAKGGGGRGGGKKGGKAAGGAKKAAAPAGGKVTAEQARQGAAKKGSISEKQAPPIVLEYMREQNRPYSVINVYDNLHGAIGKTALGRVLDGLSEEGGGLRKKVYGKSAVYWIDQETLGEVDAERVAEAKAESEREFERMTASVARHKELEARAAALRRAPDDESLARGIEECKAKVEELSKRAQALREAAGGGGAEAVKERRVALEKKLGKLKKAWKDRKRMVMTVVDSMAEGSGKKPAVLLDLMGCETDEQVGCPKPAEL